MDKMLLLGIFALFSDHCLPQKDAAHEIFQKIILENATGSDIDVSCEKSRTIFDGENFNQETGLNVPDRVLNELRLSSDKSLGGNWNPKFPLQQRLALSAINLKKCLTKSDIKKRYESSREPQLTFELSEPIFDNDLEHCVISFTCTSFKGRAYGNSYFLKKVYGSWTIIIVFDTWTS